MKTDSKTISYSILKLFSIIGFIPQPKTSCRKAMYFVFAALYLVFSIGLTCYYYLNSNEPFETYTQLLLNMYGDTAIIIVGVICLLLNYRFQDKFSYITKDTSIPPPSHKIILLVNCALAIGVVIGFTLSHCNSFTVAVVVPLGSSLNFGISLSMVISYLTLIGCTISNIERQVLMTCQLKQGQVDEHLKNLMMELLDYRKLKDSTSFGFFLILTTQEHQ